MSDVTSETPAGSPDSETAVDPNAAISRGVGMSLDAIEPDSPAGKALDEFRTLVEQQKAATAEAERLTQERNLAIYDLKTEHNVGFSAMAEVIGATSSLVLYLYERAQGKTAKQIREESVASRIAKEATRVDDPNKKSARKQTPEEKTFRKQQRDALRAFLEDQRASAAARGESTDEMDAGLAQADAEQAEDDSDT
jgi:lysyl-tRNA synthetase class I